MKSSLVTLVLLASAGAFAQAKIEPSSDNVPATPPAQDDASMAQARQHFQTGKNAYGAGDFATAIREFKAAEALRPSPVLEYNIALANEHLGKRRVAVKYYRRYLEMQPNAVNRGEVEGKIASLEAEIAKEPPVAATTQPGGTAPQPEPPAAEPAPYPQGQPQPQAQPQYDPYASRPPAGQPYYPGKPPKRKNRAWIVPVIVAGCVTLTVVAIVAVYVATNNSRTTTYYDRTPPASTAPQNTPAAASPKMFDVLRF